MEMRVGTHRMITIRYQMRNSAGELLLDATEGEPVTFLYGSGDILSHLETPLAGMTEGERRSFSLSDTEAPGLGDRYTFDVLVEHISWANESEVHPNASAGPGCGPDCDCHH